MASVSGQLPFRDAYGAARLKYLRNRSLRNPKWRRDPDQVERHLTHDQMRWSSPSVLDPELLAARSALTRYRKAARRSGGDDGLWSDMLTAVDIVLSRADELNGTKVPGRA